MEIGIVDTGVDVLDPRLKGCCIHGISLSDSCGQITESGEFGDLVGHGTSVAAMIHAFCPSAPLFAVRIAQQAGGHNCERVSERVMAAAIDSCRERRIRVVNVSYSIQSVEKHGPLERACEAARAENTIIVAAYHNQSDEPHFPAGFSCVIGVKIGPQLPRGRVAVLSESQMNVAAWGGPVTAFGANSAGMQFYYANSYATAHVSALIGRMLLVDDRLNLQRAMGYFRSI
jgi:hypothetical protein